MDDQCAHQNIDWTQCSFNLPWFNDTNENGLWAADVHESSYDGVRKTSGSSNTTLGQTCDHRLVVAQNCVTDNEHDYTMQCPRLYGNYTPVQDRTRIEDTFPRMTSDRLLFLECCERHDVGVRKSDMSTMLVESVQLVDSLCVIRKRLTSSHTDLYFSHSEQDSQGPMLSYDNRVDELERQPCNNTSGLSTNLDLSPTRGNHERAEVPKSLAASSFDDTKGKAFDSLDTVIGAMYHSGRFKCLHPGCARKSFGRQAELKRHYDTIHAAQKPSFWCCVPSCERSLDRGGYPFTRRDKLNDHVRTMHAQASRTAPTLMATE
jgi:hypothetical protein